MKILITGAAGFIGFHLTKALLKDNHEIIGIDNINDYYDVNLKYDRLEELGIDKRKSKIFLKKIDSSNKKVKFSFIRLDLENKENLSKLFLNEKFDVVCNLAAQAGVRYSIENPDVYIKSNIVGFANILECSREFKIKHLLYASSSSVYGANKKIPFSVSDNVDNPVSLYAATKKSNELMAHTYSHLFNLPTTGLRFFTVYGPWGRPDMAIYLFAKAIFNGEEIKVFNNGKMSRDFTYIDDIISGIKILLDNPPRIDEHTTPYKVFNIGNGNPISLMDFIKILERKIGIKSKKNFLPIQDGDVERTWADISELQKLNYNSSFDIQTGIGKFIDWFKVYYKL